MADYLAPSAGLEGDWAGVSGTAGNVTLAAGSDVAVIVFGGFNFNGDTAAVTLDGNAADAVLQTVNADGDGIAIFVFANPATGSSLPIAWSGMDAGDSGSWFAFGVSDADAAEIAATGFPDTGTDNTDPMSIALTTAVDDLAVAGGNVFSTNAADRWTPGTGETEIGERFNTTDDTHIYAGYEKATGTTTTLSPTDSGGDVIAGAGVVIPTAPAGGAAPERLRNLTSMGAG